VRRLGGRRARVRRRRRARLRPPHTALYAELALRRLAQG